VSEPLPRQDDKSVLATAQHLADDVLFPAALRTDAARVLPVELLDALAEAGLYGVAGPAWAGGLDADFPTMCAVVEALASGCLTTAFVWAQHLGGVMAAARSDTAVRDWTAALCRGELRAGMALGGALPGPPAMRALAAEDGWTFTGSSPFVSGWERIDVMHTAARTEDGRLVWAFVDARPSETLAVERLELVALDATNTVRVDLRDHPVPADRVTSVSPFGERPSPPELLRMHASFALGVTARCCRLLGPTPLDADLTRLRAELDRLEPERIQALRGAAGELAVRAASALVVSGGSRSLLRASQEQRLAREAIFVLVYALRPGSKEAVLQDLSASPQPA
jgi:alkylation response protein AidB-like acyl-CoA dehydrogenase